ncbi:MAG: hypothetical protein ACLRM8_02230 [Alistipes sp.]
MDTRGFKLCAARRIIPSTAGCTDRAPQEHPNILFILSDCSTPRRAGAFTAILAPYAANDNIARLPPKGACWQRVLHQLDLGAEPGRDHRAVQPPEHGVSRSTTHCAPNRTTSPSG